MSDCWILGLLLNEWLLRSQVTGQGLQGRLWISPNCMHHSQKICGGRSPPPISREDWESLTRKIELITQDCSILSWTWLSATERDIDGELARLVRWPETDLSPGQSVLKINFFIESGLKMIQFKTKCGIFIQSIESRIFNRIIHSKRWGKVFKIPK